MNQVQPPIASSIFDLRGPEFLTFYGVALVVVAIWCFIRAGRAMRKYHVPGAREATIETHEIAYLAGGALRVTQVVVVNLIRRNLVTWKSGWSGARLVPTAADAPADLASAERALFAKVLAGGGKGLRVKEVHPVVTPAIRPLEVRLATAGLRPTGAERSRARWSAVAPLIILLALGGIKVFVGLARDKPVGFLILLLFLTVVVAVAISQRVKRITPDGEAMLEKLRLKFESDRRAAEPSVADSAVMLAYGVALIGPACLSGSPAFADCYKEFGKAFQPPGGSGGDGGGCGTGCGGGGCGGGGCGGGGCGGCGGGD